MTAYKKCLLTLFKSLELLQDCLKRENCMLDNFVWFNEKGFHDQNILFFQNLTYEDEKYCPCKESPRSYTEAHCIERTTHLSKAYLCEVNNFRPLI